MYLSKLLRKEQANLTISHKSLASSQTLNNPTHKMTICYKTDLIFCSIRHEADMSFGCHSQYFVHNTVTYRSENFLMFNYGLRKTEKTI